MSKKLLKNEKGFNLLEIMIAIGILAIIMAFNSQLLQSMISGQKQQAGVVSTQFESALGLEMLRNDIANAGFGLPDEFSETISYTEKHPDVSQFDNTSAVPKALEHADTISVSGYIQNSDYLVIRSPAVGTDSAAGKWTNIVSTNVHVWSDTNIDMTTSDYMIVLRPRSTAGGNAKLIISGGVYAILYPGTTAVPTAYQPTSSAERYLAFGLDTPGSDTMPTTPSMPFNRADYYVKEETNADCATGTGTLYKAVIKHSTAGGKVEYPLIQCVANMQIVFRLDTDLDGVADSTTKDISGLDAYSIKQQVKEVHVYILAHEGPKDTGYRYTGTSSTVVGPSASLGTTVSLSSLAGSDWDRYRWKTFVLVVKPRSFY